MKVFTNKKSVAKLLEVIEKKENRPKSIRIFVAGYSCSGPKFGLVIDPANDDDLVYQQDGLSFVVNKAVDEQFGDFRVEFEDDGFVVLPVDFQPTGGCASCGGSCS